MSESLDIFHQQMRKIAFSLITEPRHFKYALCILWVSNLTLYIFIMYSTADNGAEIECLMKLGFEFLPLMSALFAFVCAEHAFDQRGPGGPGSVRGLRREDL